MYWNTRCIYGDMMYAQRESMSLSEILMNPCKADKMHIQQTMQSNGPINPMWRTGFMSKGSVPRGQVVYICVLLNIVANSNVVCVGEGAWQKENEKVARALL